MMAKRKHQTGVEQGDVSRHEQCTTDPATRVPKRLKKTTIEELNALDMNAFKKQLLHDGDNDPPASDTAPLDLELHFATSLSADALDACFHLIETTSRHDYEPSSFGWHPRRKKREMREKEMRYLIIQSRVSSSSSSSSSSDQSFPGFLSFMLTHDSTPAVPVLYIYEIHLAQEVRGRGFGQHLIKLVEDLARRAGVDKVMLTCFLSNTKALAFYERVGFSRDVSSPEDRKTRNKTVQVDYVIMSKDVRQNTTVNESDEQR